MEERLKDLKSSDYFIFIISWDLQADSVILISSVLIFISLLVLLSSLCSLTPPVEFLKRSGEWVECWDSQSDRRGEDQHTMSNMSTTSSTTRSTHHMMVYTQSVSLIIIYISVLSPWTWLTTTSSRHKPKTRPGRKPSTGWPPALNWATSKCWWRRRNTKKKTERISVDRYRW